MSSRAWVDRLLYVLLVLVWGSSFLLIRLSLEGFSPSAVALVRSVLGGLSLLAIVLVLRRRIPRDPVLWAHMVVVALAQSAMPFMLTAWVGQYIPSSLAAITNAAAPMFTVAFTPLLLRRERLTGVQIIGVVVGVVGVVVLLGPWTLIGTELTGMALPAQLAMLTSAALYGFGLVYMRRFVSGRGHEALPLGAMQVWLTAGVLLMIAPVTRPVVTAVQPGAILSLVALGVLGTGIAYVWSARLVQDWGATRMATVTYLMPVVGVVLGVGLLAEPLHWYEPVGGAIILIGVLASQRARPRPAHGDDLPAI